MSRLHNNTGPLYWTALCLLLPIGSYGFYRLYRYIDNDYRDFLSLGPGGLPSTFGGYTQTSILRFAFGHRDSRVFPKSRLASTKTQPYFESPDSLSQRSSERPTVAGVAPQRQLTQKNEPSQIDATRRLFNSMATGNPGIVSTGKSYIEKHGLALFVESYGPHGDKPAGRWPREFAHLHDTEGSMHIVLHPRDSALVLEKGWGELHLLAGNGAFTKDVLDKGLFATLSAPKDARGDGWLPPGYTMVYAPKNEEENAVVKKFLLAGAFYTGGQRLLDDYIVASAPGSAS